MASVLTSLYFSMNFTKEYLTDIVKLYESQSAATMNNILLQQTTIDFTTVYMIIWESDTTVSV